MWIKNKCYTSYVVQIFFNIYSLNSSNIIENLSMSIYTIKIIYKNLHHIQLLCEYDGDPSHSQTRLLRYRR